jgi:hypothetical protein
MGFYLTDRNTPIIGELSEVIIKRYGLIEMKLGLASYHATHPDSVQYPNANEDKWMLKHIADCLPTLDYPRFISWLAKVEAGKVDPLCPPIIVEPQAPKIKNSVIVDGELLRDKDKKFKALPPDPPKLVRQRGVENAPAKPANPDESPLCRCGRRVGKTKNPKKPYYTLCLGCTIKDLKRQVAQDPSAKVESEDEKLVDSSPTKPTTRRPTAKRK